MEQIIAESGQSASAMYRYFKGKDDIILAAITSSLGDLTLQLAPVVAAAAGPVELMETLCETIDQFCLRDGFDLRVIAVQGWAEAQTVFGRPRDHKPFLPRLPRDAGGTSWALGRCVTAGSGSRGPGAAFPDPWLCPANDPDRRYFGPPTKQDWTFLLGPPETSGADRPRRCSDTWADAPSCRAHRVQLLLATPAIVASWRKKDTEAITKARTSKVPRCDPYWAIKIAIAAHLIGW